MMNRRAPLLYCCVVPLCCVPAIAGPEVPAGFRIDPFANVTVRDMVWGSSANGFSSDIYATSGDGIITIDSAGNVTPFTTTDPLMIPTGIAFDTSGQLGGDLLICENQTGNVKRIAAIGLVTTIATINIASNGLTDLLMGPSVGAGYGFDIYVSHSAESGGDPGRVFRMTTAGSMSTLTVSNATTPTGITFASGGTFGAATLLMLDAANYTQLDGKVWTIAPGGTTNNLTPAGSTPLFDPVSLSQAPGGAFGSLVYISDFATDNIYQMDDTGNVTLFGTGFCFAGFPDYNGDMLFSQSGDVMYVASRFVVYRVMQGTQPPEPCYADCDGSGSLNIFDYICFGNAYVNELVTADCNEDCKLDVFDYICYGNAYVAGCP
ncbi:MAG: hypothetical protein H6815_01115 [Phycisphaeraceae bacterium]|nr:hypothetical protein [Phycisphaerales bacterium]MCB9859026.1 hypothetical protein [Phycisphaeraceae bacterium]